MADGAKVFFALLFSVILHPLYAILFFLAKIKESVRLKP